MNLSKEYRNIKVANKEAKNDLEMMMHKFALFPIF